MKYRNTMLRFMPIIFPKLFLRLQRVHLLQLRLRLTRSACTAAFLLRKNFALSYTSGGLTGVFRITSIRFKNDLNARG